MRLAIVLKHLPFLILVFTIVLLGSCTDNEEAKENIQTLSQTDIDALLFMYEEEKLARDTYSHLYEKFEIVQFNNIQISEQYHMDAVESLLNKYDIPYSILLEGEFVDQEIQELFNQFIEEGSIDELSALKIGATIEDLDIIDLQERINATSNLEIIRVFESLQCGSRNHLKSFVRSINNLGGTYEPQFITLQTYLEIVESDREKCGQ